MEFDFGIARSSPCMLTAPPTPRRFGEYYCFSAPTSPSRMADFYRDFDEFSTSENGAGASPSSVPFGWKERMGKQESPKLSKDDVDFAFSVCEDLERASLSAEELFDGGKIRALKPPPMSEPPDKYKFPPQLAACRARSCHHRGRQFCVEGWSLARRHWCRKGRARRVCRLSLLWRRARRRSQSKREAGAVLHSPARAGELQGRSLHTGSHHILGKKKKRRRNNIFRSSTTTTRTRTRTNHRLPHRFLLPRDRELHRRNGGWRTSSFSGVHQRAGQPTRTLSGSTLQCSRGKRTQALASPPWRALARSYGGDLAPFRPMSCTTRSTRRSRRTWRRGVSCLTSEASSEGLPSILLFMASPMDSAHFTVDFID